MRLPSFVTAETIGEHLDWANSIKRQVSQAAIAQGIPEWRTTHNEEAFYENIVRLLATPFGGYRFNELVVTADRDKQRTLSKAIIRMASHALKVRSIRLQSAVDIVRRLLQSGEVKGAAWYAFNVLSYASRVETDSVMLRTLVAQIETEDELRLALGDYWTDWLAASDEKQETSDPLDDDDLAAMWRRAVGALRASLEGSHPFDAAVMRGIQDCAETLQGLMHRQTAANTRAIEQGRRRKENTDRLRAAAAQLPTGRDWTRQLLAAVDRDEWGLVSNDDLAKGVDWLERTCAALEATKCRLADAKMQYNADGSNLSLETLNRAHTSDDKEQTLRQAEAEAFFVRLAERVNNIETPGFGI